MQDYSIFDLVRGNHQDEEPLKSSDEELRARLVQATGARDWRELIESCDARGLETFLRREFPRETSFYRGKVNRRGFLKLIGAAAAMAGLAACSPPRGDKLVPYVRQPERVTPGQSLYFATAMTLGGYATGLLVRSELGRPIKVEGNPNHPASLGATDVFAQASLLTLYDPERSAAVLQNGQTASNGDNFLAALRGALDGVRASGGAGLYLLTQTVTSPTLGSQLARFSSQFPNAHWLQYEPFSRDNARAGAQLAFGQYVETRYDLSRADVILDLDNGLLDCVGGNLRYARDFAARRKIARGQTTMNRLYAVESTPSLAGTQADHRWALRASQIAAFAEAVAAALGIAGAKNSPPAGIPANWIPALVRDLQAHRGTSLVTVGAALPPYVHALAHALNNVLGNVGTTVTYTAPVEINPADQLTSLRSLVDDMGAGRVQALFILGGNPVFEAPADLRFGERLKRVPFSVHLGLYADETASACTWHVPEAHYLEAWGDARAYDGTVSVIQPLIAPLYGGRSSYEMLSTIVDPTPRAGDQVVRGYWQGQLAGNFDENWQTALSSGVVPNTALDPISVTLKTDWIGNAPPAMPPQSYEVVFRPDPTIYDGRFANNAWLQELPKPLTRITWDNVVAASPNTARQLELDTEVSMSGGEHGQVEAEVVQVEYEGATVRAPVWILPGHPDGMVTLYAGYRGNQAPSSGDDASYNAYSLRTSRAPWIGAGLQLRPLNQRVPIATTQFHQSMEGRDLVKLGTLAQFLQNPAFAHTDHPNLSIYPLPQRDAPEQWGMVIDLNACIGCKACVIACQAENNIPVVGKAEVLRAREMHWLRIDHYFEGESSNARSLNQPVPCMHCEYAPCEVVCPTAATTHSPDGLNEMTYNRCIGTRYCSNNCPYKVRRFNFFQYADWETPSLKPLRNPDVTVRSRGVMEKCTYCVQRIRRAGVQAEREGRTIRDGEAVTACQAACPTEAIIFGNTLDPNSRVAQLKASPRNYGLLESLNTRPRTTYLAMVRNPNPEMG